MLSESCNIFDVSHAWLPATEMAQNKVTRKAVNVHA